MVAFVVLLLAGWYLITGFFGEHFFGWWRSELELAFVALPAFLLGVAIAKLGRRRRLALAAASLPLRPDLKWPAWVWIARLERVAEQHLGVRSQLLWMARQLRRTETDRELTGEQVSRLLATGWRAVTFPLLVLAVAVLLAVRPEMLAEPVAGWLAPADGDRSFLLSIEHCEYDKTNCQERPWQRLSRPNFSAEFEADYQGWIRLVYDSGPRTRRRVHIRVTDPGSTVRISGADVQDVEAEATLHGRQADVSYSFIATKFQTTLAIEFQTAAGKVLERIEVTLILRDPKTVL